MYYYEIQNRHPIQSRTCGIVQTLNKSNLPPLPTTCRQCPAHPFWVPTHANKEHDHEGHNLACRTIFKASSKTGSLWSCVVSIDIGSNERMTMRNLQIPETAESNIVPKWLFPSRFSDKDRCTSSCPDCVLVTPIAAKNKNSKLMN